MIINNEDGQAVAYVSEEYWEQINALALKEKKPTNANTPRKKVKEEVTYGTPLWLVKAIERDFDLKFVFDLAADQESFVVRGQSIVHGENDKLSGKFYYDINDNSLAQDWNTLSGDLWLNPPFANIKAWAAKCETYDNGTICMLVPASLGSKWFRDHCMGRPVFVLDSRITFDGHTDPYPKDLMLVFFHAKDRKYKSNLTENKCLFQMGSYSAKSSNQALQEIATLSEEYNLPD